jgi:hypothetical protein
VRKTLENKGFLQIAEGGIYENYPDCYRMGCDMIHNDCFCAEPLPELGTNRPQRIPMKSDN